MGLIVNPSDVLYYYVSPTIAVLTILLNSVVIGALVRQYYRNKAVGKRGHSAPLIFLINLAISDLLVGLTVTIIKVITFLYHYKLIRWSLAVGWAYHIMKYAFLRLSLLTSIFNLASLTIDRFLAIRYPMLYRIKVNNKQALAVVGMTWLLSVIFTAAHYGISNFSGITLSKYDLIIFPAVVLPAALIFTTCYTLILLEIRKQGRNMRNMMVDGCTREMRCDSSRNVKAEGGTSDEKNICSGSDKRGNDHKECSLIGNMSGKERCGTRGTSNVINSEIGTNNNSYQEEHVSEIKAVRGKQCYSHLRTDGLNTKESNRSKNDRRVPRSSWKILPLHIHKREIKIYRFAGTVVGVFLLCWLPIAICGAILMEETVNSFVMNCAFTLAFANSAIDPIVYLVFNDKVCGKMRRLLRLMCRLTCAREGQRLRRESNLFSLSSGENNSVLRKTRSSSSVISTETAL